VISVATISVIRSVPAGNPLSRLRWPRRGRAGGPDAGTPRQASRRAALATLAAVALVILLMVLIAGHSHR
jgi:hypothetical protein